MTGNTEESHPTWPQEACHLQLSLSWGTPLRRSGGGGNPTCLGVPPLYPLVQVLTKSSWLQAWLGSYPPPPDRTRDRTGHRTRGTSRPLWMDRHLWKISSRRTASLSSDKNIHKNLLLPAVMTLKLIITMSELNLFGSKLSSVKILLSKSFEISQQFLKIK